MTLFLYNISLGIYLASLRLSLRLLGFRFHDIDIVPDFLNFSCTDIILSIWRMLGDITCREITLSTMRGGSVSRGSHINFISDFDLYIDFRVTEIPANHILKVYQSSLFMRVEWEPATHTLACIIL